MVPHLFSQSTTYTWDNLKVQCMWTHLHALDLLLDSHLWQLYGITDLQGGRKHLKRTFQTKGSRASCCKADMEGDVSLAVMCAIKSTQALRHNLSNDRVTRAHLSCA